MVATTLEATLVDLIKGSAGLAAFIGTGDTARVYPVRIPQDDSKTLRGRADPAMAFSLVSVERVSAFGDDTGLTYSRYQFGCWADTLDDALGMANALRAVLQRYRDPAGENGVPVEDIMLLTENQQFDETVESYGVLVDYQVIWQEGTA